jgi:hypothetical protein
MCRPPPEGSAGPAATAPSGSTWTGASTWIGDRRTVSTAASPRCDGSRPGRHLAPQDGFASTGPRREGLSPSTCWRLSSRFSLNDYPLPRAPAWLCLHSQSISPDFLAYSPECVECAFCELRPNEILRSSFGGGFFPASKRIRVCSLRERRGSLRHATMLFGKRVKALGDGEVLG